MPNPSPSHRTRTRTPSTAVELPPGMSRRADGRLMYRYTERGQRVTVYGRTVDACYAARWSPEPDPVKVDESTTLAAYLELWLAGLDLRANTIAGHRYNVERYIVPLFGRRVRLVELERELVRVKLGELRAMTTRGGRTIAPRTIALAFSTLRAALTTAVDDGRLAVNPCARLNPNGATGKRPARRVGVELRIPTELELRRVIRATRGEERAVLLTLSIATGLRQSELLGLSVDDLDDAIATRWLHVHRTLTRFDRTLADATKNQTSERYVPVPVALVPELRAHLAELERLALVAGRRWHNPDRLAFTDATGGALVGSTLSHWFATACERAGLGRSYRWHDLRHFYASNLLAQRVPIETVSKLLGHASVVITSTTYHHVIRDDAALAHADLAGHVLEAIGG
jgi:integrase